MKKLLLFIGFSCCAGLLGAQEMAVTQAQLPEKAPFAQAFTGQYQLAHTPGYAVEIDKDSLSPDFEITQSSLTRQSPGTVSYDFTAVPFVLGKSTFTVTFVLSQDGKEVTKSEQANPLEITPVKIFNDKNLREIRPARVPPDIGRAHV